MPPRQLPVLMFTCGLSTTRIPSACAACIAWRIDASLGVRAGSGAIVEEFGSAEYQVVTISTLSLPSDTARDSEASDEL